MLRTARRYDYSSDTIIFANNRPYTRDNYSIAGVGDSADPLFNFCRHLCVMKVDNAEYALLTAIVIFSGNFLHKTLNLKSKLSSKC
jgi:ecdysone receptor